MLLWGTVALLSRHLRLKQEGLCLIPGGFPVDFSSLPAGFLMFMGMKTLWCSSTVRLLSTQMCEWGEVSVVL